MHRKLPLSQLIYNYLYPNPHPSDPPSFSAHLAKYLVGEVRIETATFYGSLDTVEARYPGLSYSHGPHRRRLGRFPHHARLFEAFDALELTGSEIAGFCRWEGTLWARQRFEKDEGITVKDTTGEEIRSFTDTRRLRIQNENLQTQRRMQRWAQLQQEDQARTQFRRTHPPTLPLPQPHSLPSRDTHRQARRSQSNLSPSLPLPSLPQIRQVQQRPEQVLQPGHTHSQPQQGHVEASELQGQDREGERQIVQAKAEGTEDEENGSEALQNILDMASSTATITGLNNVNSDIDNGNIPNLSINGEEEPELRSIGLMLNQRLLAATSAAASALTPEQAAMGDLSLDPEWEQWFRNTTERGTLNGLAGIPANGVPSGTSVGRDSLI